METYWTVDNLIYEEEDSLVKQGYGSALAIDGIHDFAHAVIIAKTEEQAFLLKLKFGHRLQPHYLNRNDTMI